ncbi:hypothetical protein PMAYCL1PPCAC_20864, partial [Pristionchus mayeri]
KGYIDNDKLTIECRVKVLKIRGISEKVTFNYDDTSNGMNNVVLKIGDRKLYVSKDLLAIHSPVFAATFFGQFAENGQNKIELQDIVYEEFDDLLNMIYPTSSEVVANNVRHILKLADRFQVKSVLEPIINYFIAADKFTLIAKLQLTVEYRLERLRDLMVNLFNSLVFLLI